MRKPTTTQQLNTAITSNLLYLTNAEIYHKSTRQTDVIDTVKFKEYFDSLCKSGLFMDAIGWHFERNIKTKKYEIECSRLDGSVDVIITAYFRKNDGVNEEDIDEMLLKIEDEEE